MAERKPSIVRLVLTIIVAAIVFFVVSMAFSFLTKMFFPYDMAAIAGSRLVTDPLMMAFFLHPLIYMVGVVILYPLLNLKWSTVEKGTAYGFILWLMISLPEAYVIFTSMSDYPTGFYIDKLLFGLVAWIATGVTIAYLLRE
ncbi:MAG: hypothetical protein NTZ73_01755 [Candidatus Diapherotrites archaeon]|nr:hypothetical protein [Candidatus Diapherotrites archaeon]